MKFEQIKDDEEESETLEMDEAERELAELRAVRKTISRLEKNSSGGPSECSSQISGLIEKKNEISQAIDTSSKDLSQFEMQKKMSKVSFSCECV